jgi:hypothetical protein
MQVETRPAAGRDAETPPEEVSKSYSLDLPDQQGTSAERTELELVGEFMARSDTMLTKTRVETMKEWLISEKKGAPWKVGFQILDGDRVKHTVTESGTPKISWQATQDVTWCLEDGKRTLVDVCTTFHDDETRKEFLNHVRKFAPPPAVVGDKDGVDVCKTCDCMLLVMVISSDPKLPAKNRRCVSLSHARVRKGRFEETVLAAKCPDDRALAGLHAKLSANREIASKAARRSVEQTSYLADACKQRVEAAKVRQILLGQKNAQDLGQALRCMCRFITCGHLSNALGIGQVPHILHLRVNAHHSYGTQYELVPLAWPSSGTQLCKTVTGSVLVDMATHCLECERSDAESKVAQILSQLEPYLKERPPATTPGGALSGTCVMVRELHTFDVEDVCVSSCFAISTVSWVHKSPPEDCSPRHAVWSMSQTGHEWIAVGGDDESVTHTYHDRPVWSCTRNGVAPGLCGFCVNTEEYEQMLTDVWNRADFQRRTVLEKKVAASEEKVKASVEKAVAEQMATNVVLEEWKGKDKELAKGRSAVAEAKRLREQLSRKESSAAKLANAVETLTAEVDELREEAQLARSSAEDQAAQRRDLSNELDRAKELCADRNRAAQETKLLQTSLYAADAQLQDLMDFAAQTDVANERASEAAVRCERLALEKCRLEAECAAVKSDMKLAVGALFHENSMRLRSERSCETKAEELNDIKEETQSERAAAPQEESFGRAADAADAADVADTDDKGRFDGCERDGWSSGTEREEEEDSSAARSPCPSTCGEEGSASPRPPPDTRSQECQTYLRCEHVGTKAEHRRTVAAQVEAFTAAVERCRRDVLARGASDEARSELAACVDELKRVCQPHVDGRYAPVSESFMPVTSKAWSKVHVDGQPGVDDGQATAEATDEATARVDGSEKGGGEGAADASAPTASPSRLASPGPPGPPAPPRPPGLLPPPPSPPMVSAGEVADVLRGQQTVVEEMQRVSQNMSDVLSTALQKVHASVEETHRLLSEQLGSLPAADDGRHGARGARSYAPTLYGQPPCTSYPGMGRGGGPRPFSGRGGAFSASRGGLGAYHAVPHGQTHSGQPLSGWFAPIPLGQGGATGDGSNAFGGGSFNPRSVL